MLWRLFHVFKYLPRITWLCCFLGPRSLGPVMFPSCSFCHHSWWCSISWSIILLLALHSKLLGTAWDGLFLFYFIFFTMFQSVQFSFICSTDNYVLYYWQKSLAYPRMFYPNLKLELPRFSWFFLAFFGPKFSFFLGWVTSYFVL